MISNEMKDKAMFYKDKEQPVHVKTTDKFYNGIIVDINDERIILLDRKLGEVYIGLNEVHVIEPFREVENAL